VKDSEFGLQYPDRQHQLLHRWGFKCTCDLCTAPAEKIIESDNRRKRVREIREEIIQQVHKSKFWAAIKLNEELMDILVEEELVAHLGEHYEILARLYFAAGDRKNAEKYGRLALADLQQYGGPDVYDSIEDLNDLLTRM
jgi:hypothetical protein